MTATPGRRARAGGHGSPAHRRHTEWEVQVVASSTFEQYADGADVEAAFNAARDAALDEHGHGGFTGTVAEKDDYVVITHTLTDLDSAAALARDLINRDDQRIADKWGPAGAIPVRQPTRSFIVEDLSGTATSTWTLDEQALNHIAQVARQRGLINDGEKAVEGSLFTYSTALRAHAGPARIGRQAAPAIAYTHGTAEIKVRKGLDALEAQTSPDGWLFFGSASS
jgi:hypothetical protein